MDVHPFSGNPCAKSFFLNSNLQAILQSPKVLLPHNCLIRYHWANMDPVKVAGYDTTYFEVSANGGQTWTIMDILSPQSPSDYIERTHSLDAYAGNNFVFRFRYRTSNNSNAHSVFLDDISIEEGSVGTLAGSSDENPRIFPNPAPGRFTVSLPAEFTGTAFISITDLMGKQVFKEQMSGPCFEADASSLTPGAYILGIHCGQHEYRQTLIIR